MKKNILFVLIGSISVFLLLSLFDKTPLINPQTIYNCNIPFDIKSNIFIYLAIIALTLFMGIQFTQNITSNIILISNALLLGGGAHNLLLRFRHICVADYLNFFNIRFNLADVCVSIGLVTIFCYNFLEYVFRTKKDNFDN